MFCKLSLKLKIYVMLFLFPCFYIKPVTFDVHADELRRIVRQYESEKRKLKAERKIIKNKIKQMRSKIEQVSEIELKRLQSTLLVESCSIGSFNCFQDALKKGAVFKPSMRDSLIKIIHARIEFYKLNSQYYGSLQSNCENLIKYVEYLSSIPEIIYSNDHFPADLNYLIFSYCIPDSMELNQLDLFGKSNSCIIS